MKFNRKEFIDYLKKEKVLNNQVAYLYNLYKVFDITDLILKKDSKQGYTTLEKSEDTIYTIRGKVLNHKQRIDRELERISLCIGKGVNDKTIYTDFQNLLRDYETLDLEDDLIIFYLKKQISIIQAKLGMKNTFFLATHDSFLEIYRNLFLNNEENTDFRNNYRR